MMGAQVVVNSAVRVEERGRELLIAIPGRKNFWLNLVSFVVTLPREKRIFLDELGVLIYQDCRQGWTVARIVENFSGRHGLSIDYSRQSVMLYLKMLAEKGVVGFLIKEQTDGGTSR